jgi:hypothetical protein
MPRWKDLWIAFMVGAGVNFPWEMAHSFLYRGVRGFTWEQHLVCCGLAALADGAGIALIFATGARCFREARRTQRAGLGPFALTVLLGLVGAVLTEHLALRLGWWAYGPAMPRLPGTELGLSPLVQFVVLPVWVLFWALPRRWKRDEATNY